VFFPTRGHDCAVSRRSSYEHQFRELLLRVEAQDGGSPDLPTWLELGARLSTDNERHTGCGCPRQSNPKGNVSFGNSATTPIVFGELRGRSGFGEGYLVRLAIIHFVLVSCSTSVANVDIERSTGNAALSKQVSCRVRAVSAGAARSDPAP
jgi:hypothetical protein